MIRDLDEGGLRVPDIFTYWKSQKLTWIKRAILQINLTEKKILDNIEFVGGDTFWHLTETGPNRITKRTIFGKFWNEVVEIWRILRNPSSQPINLFCRSLSGLIRLLSLMEILFLSKLVWSRYLFINDLIDETGNFMNYRVFSRTYDLNVSYISYADILSLKLYCRYEYTRPYMINRIWSLKQLWLQVNGHAWFHLHGQRWPVLNGEGAKNSKWKYVSSGIRTHTPQVYDRKVSALDRSATIVRYQVEHL